MVSIMLFVWTMMPRGISPLNQTLRDTLLDLHNYAAMALMLLDEGDNV